jgi:hypothetical protein
MANRLDELAQFANAPPPRRVPPAVRHGVLGPRLSRGVVLFLALAAATLLFAAFFFPRGLRAEWALHAAAGRAHGVIEKRAATSLCEVSKRRICVEPVFEYEYTFPLAGGAQQQGVGYCASATPLELGARVTVEYLADNPSVSRIEGCRVSTKPAWGALFVLMPFGCLVGAAALLVGRVRKGRVLRRGLLTTGIVTGLGVSTVQHGPTGRVDVTIEFQVDGVPHSGVFVVDGHAADLAARDEKAKRPVRLLYDRRKPSRIVVLEWLASD